MLEASRLSKSSVFVPRNAGGFWPLLLMISIFFAAPVWAQSSEAEVGPELADLLAQSDDNVELPSSAPAETSADALWRAAGLALAEGDTLAARDLWREFVERFPADRRAQSAARLAQVITSVELSPTRETDITSQSGRVQLAIFGALYGASVGLLLGLEANTNYSDADLPIWLTVAGAGAGIGLSLGLTKGDYVRPVQPALISSGAVWGYGLGLAIVGSGPAFERCTGDEFEYDDGTYCPISPTAIRMVPLALAATAVGVTSYFAHRFPDLPAGDIALVNAGGLWGTSTGLISALIFDVGSDYTPSNVVLPGMLLGLTTGALLAPQLEVSRTRMQLINLSGVLGIGLAAAIGVSAEPQTPTAWGLLLLGGQGAGLTTGALLTRNRQTSPRAAGALSSLRFSPTMLGDATGRQHRGMVLSGRW